MLEVSPASYCICVGNKLLHSQRAQTIATEIAGRMVSTPRKSSHKTYSLNYCVGKTHCFKKMNYCIRLANMFINIACNRHLLHTTLNYCTQR